MIRKKEKFLFNRTTTYFELYMKIDSINVSKTVRVIKLLTTIVNSSLKIPTVSV